MRSPRLKTGWSSLLIYVCVAILFVTATVQAAHICGIQALGTYASAQNESVASPTGPVCAMCLVIHSFAAALVLMVAFSLFVQRTPSRSILQVRFIPILTSFQLYVRPPPAR